LEVVVDLNRLCFQGGRQVLWLWIRFFRIEYANAVKLFQVNRVASFSGILPGFQPEEASVDCIDVTGLRG